MFQASTALLTTYHRDLPIAFTLKSVRVFFFGGGVPDAGTHLKRRHGWVGDHHTLHWSSLLAAHHTLAVRRLLYSHQALEALLTRQDWLVTCRGKKRQDTSEWIIRGWNRETLWHCLGWEHCFKVRLRELSPHAVNMLASCLFPKNEKFSKRNLDVWTIAWFQKVY